MLRRRGRDHLRRGVAIGRAHLQATLLTVIAGIADAVGYITMGAVFAANMTGNTVLAGIAFAEGRHDNAVRHIAPLAAFFIGAMLARLLLRVGRRAAVPILLEAAIIAAVGFLPVGPESAVLILALAMGVQASAITHFGGAAVSTVVVTSTLARTADAFVDRLLLPETRPAASGAASGAVSASAPSLLALTWIGYLIGAAAGTLLLGVMPWPLLVPAALLLVVVVL